MFNLYRACVTGVVRSGRRAAMVIAVLGPVWNWSGVSASVVVEEFTVVVGEFTEVVGELAKVIGAGVVTSVTNMVWLVWFATISRRKVVFKFLIFVSIIEHHVSYSTSCKHGNVTTCSKRR